MYSTTPKQAAAEEKLNKQGFKFSNWIPASPDAEGNAKGDLGTMIFKKRESRFSTHYREVEPDGSIN